MLKPLKGQLVYQESAPAARGMVGYDAIKDM